MFPIRISMEFKNAEELQSFVRVMSAESSYQADDAARTAMQAARDAKTPAPAAAPAAPAPTKEKTKPAPAPAAEKTKSSEPTYEQVASAITDKAKVDRASVIETLKKFGAANGKQLKPDQYADFLFALGYGQPR